MDHRETDDRLRSGLAASCIDITTPRIIENVLVHDQESDRKQHQRLTDIAQPLPDRLSRQAASLLAQEDEG